MDRDEVEVNKLAKKEQGQYPGILTEQTWSIKNLLYGFRGSSSCRIQRVVPSGQWLHLARSGGQSHRAIWVILPTREASHIIIALINRAGVLYGRILTEAVSTDRMQ